MDIFNIANIHRGSVFNAPKYYGDYTTNHLDQASERHLHAPISQDEDQDIIVKGE